VARLNRHNLALFNTEQTHLWLAFWWAGAQGGARRRRRGPHEGGFNKASGSRPPSLARRC
jgi:hypothetical protein